MPQFIELTLSEGRSVFVEAKSESAGQFRELSADTEKSVVTKAFAEVSGTLRAVAESIESELGKLKSGPRKVVVEISAEIKTGGTIFIANGSGN